MAKMKRPAVKLTPESERNIISTGQTSTRKAERFCEQA